MEQAATIAKGSVLAERLYAAGGLWCMNAQDHSAVFRLRVSTDCQGRTKTRPKWRMKIRPSGRPVACLKVAVRVG